MTSSALEALGRGGAALAAAVAAGRVAPSYLFEGTDLDLLVDAARAFAAEVILAETAPSGRARARRRLDAGDHPDLHLLGKDKATVISVSALAETLEGAWQTPVSARRQVFVVVEAEAMEAEGIARYLKILEEPPPGTVFVLVTTRPERFPDTVLSRVQRLRVPPMATREIEERLAGEGVDRARAAEAARWGAGSLARARRLAGSVVPDVRAALLAAATSAAPAAARAVEESLGLLRRDAKEARAAEGRDDADDGDEEERPAEPEEDGKRKDRAAPDLPRARVRERLEDLLHALSVDVRDGAVGRAAPPFSALGPDAAASLLEGLGRLLAAVPAHVTPAVILLEVVRHLRRFLGGRESSPVGLPGPGR